MPGTMPRASAAQQPLLAAGGSQSKYLDQVTQLVLEAEEGKKRGDRPTVTARYQQAANVLMDMVEEQRWPVPLSEGGAPRGVADNFLY